MKGDNIIKKDVIKLTYEESHKEINGTLYKLCNRCNEWFLCNEESFYKNKSSPDGLFPYCKSCAVKNSQKNYNRERACELSKLYYYTNPKSKPSIQKSCEKRRKLGKYKEYRQRDYVKEKYKTYNSNHHKHEISKKEWENCKEYFDYSCAYCGISEEYAKKQHGQCLHREHVDCNGANDISNCVPACRSCNSRKRTIDFHVWYNEDNKIFNKDRLDKIHRWLNEDYKNYIND